MGLDHSVVGVPSEPELRSWDSTDALLYAVGVGAGLGDPLQELRFTTENCEGIEQQVLPTFGVLVAHSRGRRDLGDFDRAMLVHAEQYVELHRPLPVSGTVRTTSTVTGIYDKGSGALVVTENVAVDAASGEPMVTARGGTFIRGEGGFGGPRGPRDTGGAGAEPAWERPDRAPDHQIVLQTRPEQALLYRLSGDRNPLHVDPKFAARGGFSRPILHGLCTYGVTGRALLSTLCDGDPARFGSMSGRFSRPVMPGESLTVSIWLDGDGGTAGSRTAGSRTAGSRTAGFQTALFQTARADGTVVIDRGRARFRAIGDAAPGNPVTENGRTH
jgi:acyl dehydratase